MSVIDLRASGAFDGVEEAAAIAKKPSTSWMLESAAEIARCGVPPTEFDIEGMLTREDGPAILYAPPGSLKSMLTMHMCQSIVDGTPFLGRFKVRQRPSAVLINFDAGANPTRARVAKIAPNCERFFVTSPEAFDAKAMREVFERNAGGFIVIDCLSDILQFSKNDDQALAMRSFVRDLRTLYQRVGANGVLIDHPRRVREGEGSGDYYGSIQKEAAARMMWTATKVATSESGVVNLKISCRKMSEAEPFAPFVARVTFGPDRISFDFDGRLNDVGGGLIDQPADAELLERLLHGVAGGMGRRAIESRLGWPRDRVLEAIRSSREIAADGKGKAIRYVLRSSLFESESTVTPDDSSDDSKIAPNESSESSAPLGSRTIRTIQTDDLAATQSTVDPDDSSDDYFSASWNSVGAAQ